MAVFSFKEKPGTFNHEKPAERLPYLCCNSDKYLYIFICLDSAEQTYLCQLLEFVKVKTKF